MQSDRLRPVEHAQQRNSTPTVEMLGQVSHQALHRLILHYTDADVARVFQARRKEVDPMTRPIEKLDLHLPEVMLTKFPGQPLETNQGLAWLRSHRGHQGIQDGFASSIASLPHPPQ